MQSSLHLGEYQKSDLPGDGRLSTLQLRLPVLARPEVEQLAADALNITHRHLVKASTG